MSLKSTHPVIGIRILDVEGVHGANHGMHSHENVLVDNFDETTLVIIWVTRPVDDAHLFDEGALARLSCTCKTQNTAPSSLICFILCTCYQLSRGSNTKHLFFAIRSSLINFKLPSTFQTFFTFTLLPDSSALPQTPVCSEHHPQGS